jgi:predicted HTH domain antitoxin
MVIEISDRITKKAGITEEELLLKIAIELFKEEKVTLAEASEIAGLHQIQFQKELARRKIPIHYGVDELEEDLKTLSRIKF